MVGSTFGLGNSLDYPGFIGGSYQSQSFSADAEECINLYLERTESPGATSKAWLSTIPGVTQLSATSQTPGRGHYWTGFREFAVLGQTFYEIDTAGAFTSRGTVTMDAYPATIRANGSAELNITSGGNDYNFDLNTNTLTAIAGLAGKARIGAMLDNWFIALDTLTTPSAPTAYISDLADGLTWDLTRFYQRSAQQDPWVSMWVTTSRLIWMLGSQTSEAWWNTGSAPVPFALHPSGIIPYGCAAPFSVADGEGSVFWLSQTAQGVGQVVQVGGFAPQVISTKPVENAISGYSTISDAVGDVYSDRGHTFYCLSFPTEQVTWAYDLTTQSWAKRGTWISEEGRYRVWRPRWHAEAFGQHRWLDAETGALYQTSSTVYTDVDSRPLRWLRRAPALVNENERVPYTSLELAMDVGLGIAGTGQGSNPQVMLRYSDDGGRTFGNEHWQPTGKLGEWGKRVIWNRLGQGRQRVFEIAGSDPVPTRIIGAYLDLGKASGAAPQAAA